MAWHQRRRRGVAGGVAVAGRRERRRALGSKPGGRRASISTTPHYNRCLLARVAQQRCAAARRAKTIKARAWRQRCNARVCLPPSTVKRRSLGSCWRLETGASKSKTAGGGGRWRGEGSSLGCRRRAEGRTRDQRMAPHLWRRGVALSRGMQAPLSGDATRRWGGVADGAVRNTCLARGASAVAQRQRGRLSGRRRAKPPL